MAYNHKPEKPAVLYKYLPADRALEALPEDGNGTLRATQQAALNDPFECATYCDTADPDKKEKSQEMARVLSEIIPEHPVYVDKVENSLGRIGSHVKPLGMYQVLRETWDDGFRHRRSMIQGWMGPDARVLMDPLCNHSLSLSRE